MLRSLIWDWKVEISPLGLEFEISPLGLEFEISPLGLGV